jgi:hypothetical protein
MYLFTRMARLAPGHARDGLEWAVGLTETVNQVTSLNVGLWTPVLSPGVGTLSWGMAVETLTDIEDGEAKLMADPMYLDAVERGATIITGDVDDQTAQFISNPDSPADATHVAVVQSQIANGAFKSGVEAGVEIADRATKISGLPTAFLMSVTGTYAGCAWITAARSLRELEAAQQAINGNADFIAFLDGPAGTCYLPGVTTQSIWRRIV